MDLRRDEHRARRPRTRVQHGELRREHGAAIEHGIENGIEVVLQQRRPDLVEELGCVAGLAEVIAATLYCSAEDGIQRTLPGTGDAATAVEKRSETGKQQRPAMFGRYPAEIGAEPVDFFRGRSGRSSQPSGCKP